MENKLVLAETIPTVLSSNSHAPSVVTHLARFAPDRDLLQREAERYSKIADTAQAKAIRTVHNALEEGRVLVDLENILLSRGERLNDRFSAAFPRLAIAHLDAERSYCRVYRNGTVEFRDGRKQRNVFYEFGSSTYAWSPYDSDIRWTQRYAVTPTLPPEFENRLDKKSRDHLLVWEATWYQHSQSRPPVTLDPALLEHVAGSLYAVEAVWDLTPVEVAILKPRAT